MSNKVNNSKYKIPKNSKTKPEVVEVISKSPRKEIAKEKKESKLKTPSDVIKTMSKVAENDSEEIEVLMAQGYRLNNLGILLKAMLDVKNDERNDAKFEFIKSKVQGGAALTFEDTSDIDKEINKLLLGTTEKAKEENGSTQNNSVETIK